MGSPVAIVADAPAVAAELHRSAVFVADGSFPGLVGLFALSLSMKMRSYAANLLLKS